jgi:hypothetical protein
MADADTPTNPRVYLQQWAELHVDELVFRLVAPWRLEKLQEALEEAMATGKVLQVRAYTELNGETTVLVNPARARAIWLTKRPELVPRGGMPDAT